MSTKGEPAVFELRAGPFSGRELDVVELRGREGISRLWAFDVLTVTRAPAGSIVESLLGRPARLSIEIGERAPRVFSGIVAAVTLLGPRGEDGASGVRIRVVPRMWLLKRRTHSRIFQDQTVHDIVATVLAGLDVPCLTRLTRTHEPKEYCVQYEETDYEFVTRLLAEEGIWFCFEPAADLGSSDVVVLADGADYVPIDDPHLIGRPHDGLRAPSDYVSGFAARREIKSKAVLLKDFDHHRPRYDLAATAGLPSGDAAGAAAGIEAAMLRVYEHAGHYQAPDVSNQAARVTLDQLRRRALVARGESRSARLAAGKRFSLAEHPTEEHNRDWVVTQVDHRGRVPERLAGAVESAEEVYRNTFECVPAEVPYRPRRLRRTPRQVVETAIVVGPPGEEIYTDAIGRIKVQFHWDIDGQRSCWVRVSQAWAGSGWGFQFIPRIGMEVLVSFIGGDTDKPVVTGCLMNPLAPPSHALPADATRSGIRTSTVPGGGGSNEVSFEDRGGRELLYLHAQRNMEVVVRQDQTTAIGRFGEEEPAGDQRLSVAADQSVSVGKNRSLRVGADLEEDVLGSHSERVGKHATRHVGGSIEERCAGGVTQEIGRGLQLRVNESQTTDVARDLRLHVGGDLTERVGGSATLTVAGDVGRAVRGGYAVTATEGVTITSNEAIRLVCGDSVIELGPKEIVLSGRAISVRPSASAEIAVPGASLRLEKNKAEIHAGDARIFGKGASVVLGGDGVTAAGKKTVELFSQGASVVLDADAAMDGATVKLNCGADGAGDFQDPDEGDESFIDVALTQKMPKMGDPTVLEDAPVPGARFVVETSDGRKLRGVLDGEGRARVPIPKGPAKVSFPDYDAGRVKPG